MQELILRIEASIKQTEWELENTSKVNNLAAWHLIQGRLNGYKHVLEMINTQLNNR